MGDNSFWKHELKVVWKISGAFHVKVLFRFAEKILKNFRKNPFMSISLIFPTILVVLQLFSKGLTLKDCDDVFAVGSTTGAANGIAKKDAVLFIFIELVCDLKELIFHFLDFPL